MRFRSGGTPQGGLIHHQADFHHENIFYPVIGVIQSVFCSDDPLNTLSAKRQDGRSAACQARVLIINDGTSSPTILPNVMVLPPGSTGVDNFLEEVPKGTTGTIDGSILDEDTQPWKFNGDWCVVQFVGGSIYQPIMTSWFPHPGNRRDPTTKDSLKGNLRQGRRWARRFAGSRLVITSKGTLILDTSEANSSLKEDLTTRDLQKEGGDVRVTIKKDRELEINFNPSVFDPNEPDFLYPPGAQDSLQKRKTDATRLLADEDFIRALAGKVVELQGSEKVVFGDKDTASENLVLGQEFKTLLSTLLEKLLTHTHSTGVGPSGAPLPPESVDFATLKTGVDTEQQLSTWIFGQKNPV